MFHFRLDKSFATELDSQDKLASYRERFFIPEDKNGHRCIYLCGNSLGLQPKTVRKYLQQELDDWARLGVEGHFEAKSPWLPYHEFLTEQTARLVGAKSSEVVVMNTLTVNLHLMMVSFYRPTQQRFKILMESNAFPSDQYAVQSQVKFHGFDPTEAILEVAPRRGEDAIRIEDIESILETQGDSIALVLFGGVSYLTGQAFELEKITKAGHAQGCRVGFDLAHAAGNLVLNLHACEADFAVWCSYKYLNGGPGCVAGCFVHEKHARADLPKFSGWWGQKKENRFQMRPEFDSIPGAEGWQLSNPPILALAALRASMDIFDEVGVPALREKSERLTSYLAFLLNERLSGIVEIFTPSEIVSRGCQLSLSIKEKAKELHSVLTEKNVICDWREPNVIRVAPVPLYNSYKDVYDFVEVLAKLLIK